MTPALMLTFIAAALLATIPVRRLQQAGWTTGALGTAWVIYVAGVVMGIDMGLGSKVLLPVLVVLFVAPFVAGQRRLEAIGRILGAVKPAEAVRPVINVTPASPGVDAAPPPAPAQKRRGRKPPVEYR
jgi:hypothetical protein